VEYYCLIYLDDAKFAGQSPKELSAWVEQMLDSDDELRRQGHYVTSDALAHPDIATSVRVRSGKLSVTDGPFAETKEHLSGFIKIEARDLDEAIQIAGRIPMARIGTIEVRPVQILVDPRVADARTPGADSV
jgi:hypothetical protein